MINPLKLLTAHVEKIIFFALLFLFAVLNLNLVIKIKKEMKESDQIAQIKAADKPVITEAALNEENYIILKETLKNPKSYNELHIRDIFNKPVARVESDVIIQVKPPEELDSDRDGMPDWWEKKYGLNPDDPFDSKKDKDGDQFTNYEEFIAETDPTDPESFPGKLKLKIVDIYRLRVRIRFLGYSQEPDNNYKIQINWANRTYFVKLGEKIHGYKILDFTKDFTKHYNKLLGAEEVIESSYIRLQKNEETIIKVVIGQPFYEKELYAKLKDELTQEIFDIHGGSTVKSYEVLDITPSKVIIVRNEKKHTLLFERSQ